MIPAFQMIAGKPAPVFPRRIATRFLPTKHLAAVVRGYTHATLPEIGEALRLPMPSADSGASKRERARRAL
jgi:hypothetical protein